MAEKISVSGLMTFTHEVERFENLFYKTINSAYYQLDAGLDWKFFLTSDYKIPLQSFLSYLVQQAAIYGIIVEKITGEIVNFTLVLNVTIEGFEFQLGQELKEG